MTCPETVLDLKNTVEHSAFINDQAVTVAKRGPTVSPRDRIRLWAGGEMSLINSYEFYKAIDLLGFYF